MTDVCQGNEIGLQNQEGVASLGKNVSPEQSQDLEQTTNEEQCQNMGQNASYSQDSDVSQNVEQSTGSCLDQNVEQNINACVIALPEAPSAGNLQQIGNEETLQGRPFTAYGQTTDVNSAYILPPSYDAAMVEGQVPVSSAVVPIDMHSQSLPIEMGAQNLAYQHTEAVEIAVITPSAVEVVTVGNPDGDGLSLTPSEEEELGCCMLCCLCLRLAWDCFCCLWECLSCIMECLG
eukprot:Seg2713.8 transcript_id=Seg2713.8/GoldUCD/mRNA.D3Y31 product="hypothetical protein" protein_id=Seg2713.8/GoldUCD/D3Y31